MQGYDPEARLSGHAVGEGLRNLEHIIGQPMTDVLIEEMEQRGLELQPEKQYAAKAILDLLKEIVGIEGAEAIVIRIVSHASKEPHLKSSGNVAAPDSS